MKKSIVQTALFLLSSFSGLYAQQSFAHSYTDTAKDSLIKAIDNPFTSFQLQAKDGKKVLLQWSLHPGHKGDYFNIERNVDGKNYETIGVIRSTDGLTAYEFTDEIPVRGNSSYRIRFTNKDGASLQTDSIQLKLPGSALFSFYPNPVDNVLIIRSAIIADVQIADGMGKPRINRSIGLGPSVVDVSSLEKGVYFLRITDRSSGQQQVEKILKN